MINLKAFCSFSDLISNSPDVVGKLGELSKKSTTYVKDVKTNVHDGKILSTFEYQSDVVTSVISQSRATFILNVCGAIRSKLSTMSAPYDILDLRSAILVSFPGELSNLIFGAIVTNGFIALPEYVEWEIPEGENIVHTKVWFADYAFQRDFDSYSYEIIPPISPVDTLFSEPSVVQTLMTARKTSDLVTAINTKRGNAPETTLATLNIEYVKPSVTLDLDWTFLVYGSAGLNTDLMKDALQEYLRTNSQMPETAWRSLLPEIYERTEFLIVPLWDKVAVPDLSNNSGIYSTVLKLSEVLPALNSITPWATLEYITARTEVFHHRYKNISMLVLPGNTNAPGKTALNALFRDYIPVNTSSLDYARMSKDTQDFSSFLNQLLIQAEGIHVEQILEGSRSVTRSGNRYISASLNEITYYVRAR